MAASPRHFRSSPQSRHALTRLARQFRANNGSHQTYSITSSAVASTNGGMVRPSVLAVLRLMTRSNFVGCSMGMSAAGLRKFNEGYVNVLGLAHLLRLKY